MNRVVKFRAKRIDNGEWVYGYLSFDFNCANEYVPFIFWKDSSYVGEIGEAEVDPETIGQYVGIHDSENHKEIYEGDIVITDAAMGVCKFFDCKFVIEDIERKGHIAIPSAVRYSEVIGNIYDNPGMVEELLEENRS